MPAPDFIAAQDTLLGLLQRGRGEGYRRALSVPKTESHALLVQCITRDPRMDSQVESRDEYYASIAIDIELPLEPLAEYLRTHDDPSQGTWATSLTVTTLTELAKRSYRNAEEILCNYIEWGQWWDWPVDDLLSLPADTLHQRVAHAIEVHFPTDGKLDEAVQSWANAQFVKLSRFSARISASISKVPTKTSENSSPDTRSLSPRELLDMADQENYRQLGKAMAEIVDPSDVDLLISRVSPEQPFVAHVAFSGLMEIATPSLAEWLTQLWITIPEPSAKNPANLSRVIFRQGVSRIALRLPAEVTLPIARDWITQQDSRKQQLAKKLLQEHATAEDLPSLRESLLPMMTDEDAEWGCFMVKAFYNLPNIGTIRELIDIFYHFRFSKGRYYAAKAIQTTSPEFFAETMATECLWDCEGGTRELGVKFAPIETTEAVNRIRRLAGDSFESKIVREEAKARLTNFPL